MGGGGVILLDLKLPPPPSPRPIFVVVGLFFLAGVVDYIFNDPAHSRIFFIFATALGMVGAVLHLAIAIVVFWVTHKK